MQFSSLLTYFFCAALTLASPVPLRTCIPIEAVYTIESFTSRLHDGQNIDTVSFDIKSADGGSLDLSCIAYDPVLDGPTKSFESGKLYSCGKNSSFSFSYTPNAGETVDDLFLWQEISAVEIWGGTFTPAVGICKAGGGQANDLLCVAPNIGNPYVEMERLGV